MAQVDHSGGDLFNWRVHGIHKRARPQADHEDKDNQRGQAQHFVPAQRVDLNALMNVMAMVIVPVSRVGVRFMAMIMTVAMTGLGMVFGMPVVRAVAVAWFS